MSKTIFLITLLFLNFSSAKAQSGSINVIFTPDDAHYKTINIKFTKPLFKFDNPHGYWYVNSDNGTRHFNLQPDLGYGNADVAFISIGELSNDFTLLSEDGNDSTQIELSNASNVISAPKYDAHNKDGKPMQVHIATFSTSEIAFTLSGNAESISRHGDNPTRIKGTITGTAHFYREAKFLQTDILPGCNCDATIYPKVFDSENNIRSASQCEVALKNKVFIAMQKTFAPVFANVGSNTKEKPVPGDIVISMLAGHTNIDLPAMDPDYCNTGGVQRITGFNAQKFYYNNEDGYGIRLIKLATDDQLGITSITDANSLVMKNYMDKMKQVDSLSKLFQAKKITMEEYMKKGKIISDNAVAATSKNNNNDAFEKAKVDTYLSIEVLLNPDNAEMMLMKVSDKNKTTVEHNIKGAAFEIFSPMLKDNDGTYLLNKKFLYFGKFTPPVNGKSGGGYDAKVTKAIYPVNGNKLSVYNIIIRMEGSRDMMDKAISNIDFSALQQLISKQ